MKVKVEKTEKVEEQVYPCLMIAKGNGNGNIYIMIEERKGMRIRSINGAEVGQYSESLYAPKLEIFHGSITLEND
ncbi:MAG: hypothetical protein ABFS03_00770 [Chloroflexota bacterium]